MLGATLHFIIIGFLVVILLGGIWRAFLNPGAFFASLGRFVLGGLGLLCLGITVLSVLIALNAGGELSWFLVAVVALGLALLCRSVYKKIAY
ncbi:hypothetical protein [Arthrobacter sp. NPDC089319]|uniref:hypothetical protein n=1 Tax=Arthrobacter sp. NPDC089319 TaxID=3155915 RepID=UPI0034413D56